MGVTYFLSLRSPNTNNTNNAWNLNSNGNLNNNNCSNTNGSRPALMVRPDRVGPKPKTAPSITSKEVTPSPGPHRGKYIALMPRTAQMGGVGLLVLSVRHLNSAWGEDSPPQERQGAARTNRWETRDIFTNLHVCRALQSLSGRTERQANKGSNRPLWGPAAGEHCKPHLHPAHQDIQAWRFSSVLCLWAQEKAGTGPGLYRQAGPARHSGQPALWSHYPRLYTGQLRLPKGQGPPLWPWPTQRLFHRILEQAPHRWGLGPQVRCTQILCEYRPRQAQGHAEKAGPWACYLWPALCLHRLHGRLAPWLPDQPALCPTFPQRFWPLCQGKAPHPLVWPLYGWLFPHPPW